MRALQSKNPGLNADIPLQRGCNGIPERYNFWDLRVLRYKFLPETRRLWDMEVGEAHITNVQAALIMALSSHMDSKDLVASKYFEQCITMAQ